jgi:hypothetical protein
LGFVACTNVLENGGDDAGDHSEFAAAFRAGLYVDGGSSLRELLS